MVAASAGAHRVELCSGYAVGGTTPSIGALIAAKELCKIPIYVMIRPRGGDFTYTENEKNEMLKDIELAISYQADGIVFGALNNDGTVDRKFCKSIIKLCKNVPVTFHRAIDVCSNIKDAITFLTSIGVKYILTSGTKTKALEGIKQIRNMQLVANNNIIIMAGSGVNEENIMEFAKVGITHFHSSASIIKSKNKPIDKINFNANLKNNEQAAVNKQKVEAMIEQLKNYFQQNASN